MTTGVNPRSCHGTTCKGGGLIPILKGTKCFCCRNFCRFCGMSGSALPLRDLPLSNISSEAALHVFLQLYVLAYSDKSMHTSIFISDDGGDTFSEARVLPMMVGGDLVFHPGDDEQYFDLVLANCSMSGVSLLHSFVCAFRYGAEARTLTRAFDCEVGFCGFSECITVVRRKKQKRPTTTRGVVSGFFKA